MTDPTRRDALIRSFAPWLATLDEDDIETVDTLVFHLLATRGSRHRNQKLVAELRAMRDRVLSPPTKGIEAGLRELAEAPAVASPPDGVACEFEMVDYGGEGG